MPDTAHNTPKRIVGKPFKKGISGNPGGKPKELKSIQTEARKLAPEALRVLGKVMRNDRASGAARALAANSLLDRAYGKPPQLNTAQAVEFKRAVDMTDQELERIIARAQAGAEAVLPPPVVEEEQPDVDHLH